MAKKKEFNNLVEESFNEGYTSEPEVTAPNPSAVHHFDAVAPNTSPQNLSENEILLNKILSEDEGVINELLNFSQRSTYYLTELHRECIEVKSREDVVTKQEVVRAALENYFDVETVEAAKRELIRKKIKALNKEIKETNNK